jgi:anthranilate/para-aminobenzoate synthase component I
MDLNIAIRTIVVKGSDVYFQTGGGRMADSDPASEYQETIDKAEGPHSRGKRRRVGLEDASLLERSVCR